MTIATIDLDISLDHQQPPFIDAPHSADALKDLDALQKTAPHAYAYLKQSMAQQASMLVLSLPTHIVRRSVFANRAQASLTGASFRELKNSIDLARGNSQPIVVRPVTSPSLTSFKSTLGFDAQVWEIVAGHRRHQACQELGLPVRAMVVPVMSDSEMIAFMHVENQAREPLSAWETGTFFRNCLNQGVFRLPSELARAFGRDPSDVSRALALADLPGPIVKLFAHPTSLQYKDADVIKRALESHGAAVMVAVNEAVLAGEKLSRIEVLKILAALSGKLTSVGSTNIARKVSLLVGSESAGFIAWDANGQGVVNVNQVLSPEAQIELESMLTKLLARAKRSGEKQPLLPGKAKA